MAARASYISPRRGARVVEWDGLENRCTGNRTVGSNPTLSAISNLVIDGECLGLRSAESLRASSRPSADTRANIPTRREAARNY